MKVFPNGNIMIRIGSLKVVIDQNMHNYQFVRWKRVHKRKRIAKKWRKRYGAVIECFPKFFNINNTIMSCPCGIAALKKQSELNHKTTH